MVFGRSRVFYEKKTNQIQDFQRPSSVSSINNRVLFYERYVDDCIFYISNEETENTCVQNIKI